MAAHKSSIRHCKEPRVEFDVPSILVGLSKSWLFKYSTSSSLTQYFTPYRSFTVECLTSRLVRYGTSIRVVLDVVIFHKRLKVRYLV